MSRFITRKNHFRLYTRLSVTAVFISLCLYVLSVSATEQRLKPSATYMPTKLAVINSQTTALYSTWKGLQLNAVFPDGLTVGHSQIHWQIQQAGKVIRQLKGKRHNLVLADGLYKITLRVGRYEVSRQIKIRKNQSIRPYFGLNIGRLQVQANHPVNWRVTGPNIDYKTTKQYIFDEIVPAGEYQVRAILPALVQQKKVRVQSGQSLVQEMSVPLGKVDLMAVQDKQPLLKPVQWEVFRLESGKRFSIGQYRLHSNSLHIPPGQYEAVVQYQNKVSKRRFWVQRETTNKVILTMD